jgi:alpha-tubulin suppressor-like RCC1 family protein
MVKLVVVSAHGSATLPSTVTRVPTTAFARVGAFAPGAGATGGVPTSGGGALQTWGSNGYSQLGVGDALDKSSPTTTGLSGVAQLSFAYDHSCARTTTNQVFCWGTNNLGQVGDNSTTTRVSPVQVTDLGTTATDVCAGGQSSCAVNASGTAYCWGSNSSKALGDGTFTDRRRPAMVVGLPATVADVECGQSTNCARLTTGEVWCWGYNENGEHGDGVTGGLYDPSKALLPRPATDLSYRSGSGCAVLDDARVFCWGYSTGTPLSGVVPSEVAGLTGATKVYNGGGSACAKRTDGSVWCWGGNGHGELGRGYRGDGWTPEKPWLPAP